MHFAELGMAGDLQDPRQRNVAAVDHDPLQDGTPTQRGLSIQHKIFTIKRIWRALHTHIKMHVSHNFLLYIPSRSKHYLQKHETKIHNHKSKFY